MFLDSGKCFWILGSVLDSGKRFWILGSVLDSGKCFWVLGSAFGFWKVLLDSGTCFGFWDMLLDSGKCFWILGSAFGFWEVFLDSGKCFVPMGYHKIDLFTVRSKQCLCCYFEHFRDLPFSTCHFAEQTFPCYLPLLATLPDFDASKVKRHQGWYHHSRRWSP